MAESMVLAAHLSRSLITVWGILGAREASGHGDRSRGWSRSIEGALPSTQIFGQSIALGSDSVPGRSLGSCNPM